MSRLLADCVMQMPDFGSFVLNLLLSNIGFPTSSGFWPELLYFC